LERLGHSVEAINLASLYPYFRLLAPFHVRTGFRLVAPLVAQKLRGRLEKKKWDLLWVDGGPELSPGFYRWAKARGKPIANYNCDNPFVSRDHRKWDLYRKCLPFHDLTLLPRPQNVRAAAAQGAKNPLLVPHCYDPVAHNPGQIRDAHRGSRPLLFVGSWMPERGPLMSALLKARLPLQIFGDHWAKAAEWKVLREAWQGPAVYGPSYVRLILESQVSLGLLSAGNEDDHTQRSLEIPFIGGAAFCAQRTPKHEEMYREGEEAVFWEDPEECAVRVRQLLPNPQKCATMARQARQRVCAMKISNDDILARALSQLGHGQNP